MVNKYIRKTGKPSSNIDSDEEETPDYKTPKRAGSDSSEEEDSDLERSDEDPLTESPVK